MKKLRELHLIPVVLFAAVCLLALKVLGFVVDDPTPFTAADTAGPSPLPAVALDRAVVKPADGQGSAAGDNKGSWAKQMFNYPDVTGSVKDAPAPRLDTLPELPSVKPASPPVVLPPDVTGSAGHGSSKPKEPPKPKAADPSPSCSGTLVPLQPPAIPPGERALLERLQERRQELDSRARELDVRESLLQNAEKQLEGRIGELKAIEERIKAASEKKDDGEQEKLKSLVKMYEVMKAKDAARIFDRLDMKVLLDVASLMNPRQMSDILAQMTPANAEKVTVELANRATATVRTPSPDELPKIEGRTSMR